MIWAVFAGCAALASAAMPLLHQHFKPDSLSMLFWLRVFSFLALLPYVIYVGVPTNIWFYVGCLVVSVWMSLSDIVYFNAVKKHGAGVVSRVLPMAAIATFFLWFAVDPALVIKYVENPGKSAIILGALFFGVFCATRLRHCTVSTAALRDIWFVLLSAAIGPIVVKKVLELAPADVAPTAFGMTQGILVGLGYLGYQLLKHPVENKVFFGRHAIFVGAVIAVSSMISIVGKAYAYQYVDNPAFVSVVLFTAPFLIGLYERAIGKPDESNKFAGFGLVVSAAILVVFQIR